MTAVTWTRSKSVSIERRKSPWLADLQLGKRTPTYSSKVCEQRIRKHADKVRKLTDIQRKDHPVKDARVWILGDVVGGITVFPGQAWQVDSSLYRQVVLDGPRIMMEQALFGGACHPSANASNDSSASLISDPL